MFLLTFIRVDSILARAGRKYLDQLAITLMHPTIGQAGTTNVDSVSLTDTEQSPANACSWVCIGRSTLQVSTLMLTLIPMLMILESEYNPCPCQVVEVVAAQVALHLAHCYPPSWTNFLSLNAISTSHLCPVFHCTTRGCWEAPLKYRP